MVPSNTSTASVVGQKKNAWYSFIRPLAASRRDDFAGEPTGSGSARTTRVIGYRSTQSRQRPARAVVHDPRDRPASTAPKISHGRARVVESDDSRFVCAILALSHDFVSFPFSRPEIAENSFKFKEEVTARDQQKRTKILPCRNAFVSDNCSPLGRADTAVAPPVRIQRLVVALVGVLRPKPVGVWVRLWSVTSRARAEGTRVRV